MKRIIPALVVAILATIVMVSCDEMPHECAPDSPVQENLVPATCVETGSYDEVTYCVKCGKELSRTPKTLEKTPHTPAEPVKENIIPATCTIEGSFDEVVYCSHCNVQLSRTPKVIPTADGHVPAEAVQENVVPATCQAAGSYDAVVYCQKCTEELSRTSMEIPIVYHQWEGGECKFCHIAEHACMVTAPVFENIVPSTCTVKGHQDQVFYCSICHFELSRTQVELPLAEHIWDPATNKCTQCQVDRYSLDPHEF